MNQSSNEQFLNEQQSAQNATTPQPVLTEAEKFKKGILIWVSVALFYFFQFIFIFSPKWIKNKKDVKKLSEYADAVVVGSSIIKRVEEALKKKYNKIKLINFVLNYIKSLTSAL